MKNTNHYRNTSENYGGWMMQQLRFQLTPSQYPEERVCPVCRKWFQSEVGYRITTEEGIPVCEICSRPEMLAARDLVREMTKI